MVNETQILIRQILQSRSHATVKSFLSEYRKYISFEVYSQDGQRYYLPINYTAHHIEAFCLFSTDKNR